VLFLLYTTSMTNLSNQPPKGTYDWMPEEFAVRKYIFDTWRRVCQRFGYQEYLTPLVEYSNIYRAKSGDEVGGAELTVFEDRGGRELAIRPEMTPSVTRMVSKIYAQATKPLRLFSIANFYRNEKPQRGRNREFWQLNFDMFGIDSATADLEILQMALEIMLAFNPPVGSFTMYINSRRLIDAVLAGVDNKIALMRLLDKSTQLPPEVSPDILDLDRIKPLPEYIPVEQLMDKLKTLGYEKWIKFDPKIMRGFDYYDGMVFEVFDNNPENSRSMFGGGRYNGLAEIFGGKSFPAVGCAPGDETTKLFLESWKLIPKLKSVPTQVLVTIFSPDLYSPALQLSSSLRKQGINVELYPDANAKLDKQLKYASKKGIPYVVILGPEEMKNCLINLKNMTTGEQKLVNQLDIPQIVL